MQGRTCEFLPESGDAGVRAGLGADFAGEGGADGDNDDEQQELLHGFSSKRVCSPVAGVTAGA